MQYRRGSSESAVIISVVVFVGLLTFGGCWAYPNYNVWQQGMAGQAKLAEAESSRKIAIAEAQAKRDAASMLAEAEVARARGVAEANKIIGDSLKGNEAYLRWLWIDGLKNDNNQIIYIPTEAGLPILEAGHSSVERK